jgi:hypothetical protein
VLKGNAFINNDNDSGDDKLQEFDHDDNSAMNFEKYLSLK